MQDGFKAQSLEERDVWGLAQEKAAKQQRREGETRLWRTLRTSPPDGCEKGVDNLLLGIFCTVLSKM